MSCPVASFVSFSRRASIGLHAPAEWLGPPAQLRNAATGGSLATFRKVKKNEKKKRKNTYCDTEMEVWQGKKRRHHSNSNEAAWELAIRGTRLCFKHRWDATTVEAYCLQTTA
jgi:hypothetical protein